ncbi:unnamed protein product [Closterium sp. Naga37s-1]|nr:unnamed protein product [Closterium sp. Naga37s-1]
MGLRDSATSHAGQRGEQMHATEGREAEKEGWEEKDEEGKEGHDDEGEAEGEEKEVKEQATTPPSPSPLLFFPHSPSRLSQPPLSPSPLNPSFLPPSPLPPNPLSPSSFSASSFRQSGPTASPPPLSCTSLSVACGNLSPRPSRFRPSSAGGQSPPFPAASPFPASPAAATAATAASPAAAAPKKPSTSANRGGLSAALQPLLPGTGADLVAAAELATCAELAVPSEAPGKHRDARGYQASPSHPALFSSTHGSEMFQYSNTRYKHHGYSPHRISTACDHSEELSSSFHSSPLYISGFKAMLAVLSQQGEWTADPVRTTFSAAFLPSSPSHLYAASIAVWGRQGEGGSGGKGAEAVGRKELGTSKQAGTPIHTFSCSYDLSHMPPNSKTFIRQRTLLAPKHAATSFQEASGCSSLPSPPPGRAGAQEQQEELQSGAVSAVRAVIHLQFQCLPKTRSAAAAAASGGDVGGGVGGGVGDAASNSCGAGDAGDAGDAGGAGDAGDTGDAGDAGAAGAESRGGKEAREGQERNNGVDGRVGHGEGQGESLKESRRHRREGGRERRTRLFLCGEVRVVFPLSAPTSDNLKVSLPCCGLRLKSLQQSIEVRRECRTRMFLYSDVRVVFPLSAPTSDNLKGEQESPVPVSRGVGGLPSLCSNLRQPQGHYRVPASIQSNQPAYLSSTPFPFPPIPPPGHYRSTSFPQSHASSPAADTDTNPHPVCGSRA